MLAIIKKFSNGRRVEVARYPSEERRSAMKLLEVLEECAMLDREDASFEMASSRFKIHRAIQIFLRRR